MNNLVFILVLSLCPVLFLSSCSDNRLGYEDNKMIVCTEGGKITLFKEKVDVLKNGYGDVEVRKNGKYISSIIGGQCIVVYDTKETK